MFEIQFHVILIKMLRSSSRVIDNAKCEVLTIVNDLSPKYSEDFVDFRQFSYSLIKE